MLYFFLRFVVGSSFEAMLGRVGSTYFRSSVGLVRLVAGGSDHLTALGQWVGSEDR